MPPSLSAPVHSFLVCTCNQISPTEYQSLHQNKDHLIQSNHKNLQNHLSDRVSEFQQLLRR